MLWALICQLQTAITAMVAEIWAIDPKGGAELGYGKHMFTRFAYGNEWAYVELLEDAVAVMERRQAAMMGVKRNHKATTQQPHIFVIIDEALSLTAFLSNRKLKVRINTALGKLISQGRHAGITVILCVQDPKKDVMPLRDLIPLRLAMRLTSRAQVAMLLGDNMWAKGAKCDKIPEETPGVTYGLLPGAAEPTKMRASNILDGYIKELPGIPVRRLRHHYGEPDDFRDLDDDQNDDRDSAYRRNAGPVLPRFGGFGS